MNEDCVKLKVVVLFLALHCLLLCRVSAFVVVTFVADFSLLGTRNERSDLLFIAVNYLLRNVIDMKRKLNEMQER